MRGRDRGREGGREGGRKGGRQSDTKKNERMLQSKQVVVLGHGVGLVSQTVSTCPSTCPFLI